MVDSLGVEPPSFSGAWRRVASDFSGTMVAHEAELLERAFRV
jgi:hypothetical protein